MRFSEKWLGQSAKPSESEGEVEDSLYDIRVFPEEDNQPTIAYYQPLSLEELAEETIDEDESPTIRWEFPNTDSGDVDWPSALEAIKDWIDSSLVDPWERDALDDWDLSEVLDDRRNGEHLDSLHHAISGLAKYTDVREFSAWLSEAKDLLQALQQQMTTKTQRITSRRSKENLTRKLVELEREIHDFELEWDVRSQFAAFEEAALNHYVKGIVLAQRRVKAKRSTHEGIGRFGRKPKPTSIRTPYDFEHYCCEWMIYLGASDAEVSVATGDGGVDVLSGDYVAQVKMFNGPIPVAYVRDLLGTAVDFDRKPLFFASMGYSKGGIEFADRNGIALFVVDTYRGTISASNDAAGEALRNGLHG